MNGKGDKPRPTNLTRYGAGWDRVFGNHYNCDNCGMFTDLSWCGPWRYCEKCYPDPDLAKLKHRDINVTYKGTWRDLAKPTKNT